MLTKEEVLDEFAYDRERGVLINKKDRGANRRAKAGSVAGFVHDGYVVTKIDGRCYRIHRLIWFIEHGKFPEFEIDHANGDKLDNRIANLREATHAENQRNSGIPRHNTSGYKGVYRRSSGRFSACIRSRGKSLHLGSFDTKEEAYAAYCAKGLELHGMFFHDGGVK